MKTGDDFRYDGIIDEEKFGKFKESTHKILWLLREPNLKNKPRDWGLIEFLGNLTKTGLFRYHHWHATWGFVIKTSWGILYNCAYWAEISPAKEIAGILEYIAVVNINKRGGGRQTDMVSFHSAFRDQKLYEPVLRQIEEINPDIIIGGGTLALFYENGVIFNTEPGKIDFDGKNIWGCVRDGRLWIDSYHPNQRRMKQKDLYRQIVEEVKKFCDNHKE